MPSVGKGGYLGMNNTYPYPYSTAEARKRNELSLWRESHKANIACRNAIEDAIRQNFDGMNLQTDCLKAGAGGIRLQAHRVGACQHPARTQVGWTFRPCQQAVGREDIYSHRSQPQQRFCCPKPSGRAGWLRQFLLQGGAGVKSLWRGALCR